MCKKQFDIDIMNLYYQRNEVTDTSGYFGRVGYCSKRDFEPIKEKAEKYVNKNGTKVYSKEITEGKNNTPPNMACFASSSRMILTSICDDFDVIPEVKLYCGIPRAYANLDAMLKNSDVPCYIEAKCHEIFDSHSLVWPSAYEEKLTDLGFIVDASNGKCVISKEQVGIEKEIGEINKDRLRFDVKQFVCHILGIANTEKRKKTELRYLLYAPGDIYEAYSDTQYKIFEAQMRKIVNSPIIKKYLNDNNILVTLQYKTSIEGEPNVFGPVEQICQK